MRHEEEGCTPRRCSDEALAEREFAALWERRCSPFEGLWEYGDDPSPNALRLRALLGRGLRVSHAVWLELLSLAYCTLGGGEDDRWRVAREIWYAAPLSPDLLASIDRACVAAGRPELRRIVAMHPDAGPSLWRAQLRGDPDADLVTCIGVRAETLDATLAHYCKLWQLELARQDAILRRRADRLAEFIDVGQPLRFWMIVSGLLDPGPIPASPD